MNILFVCKYNRFRSRVAEAYFNKINRNKKVKAISAGLIKGWTPLDFDQVRITKRFGIDILGEPQTLSTELLKNIDKIIIAADNVPIEIFDDVDISGKKVKFNAENKLISWKIPDVGTGDIDMVIEKTIKSIMIKVEEFVKEIEND